MEVVLRCPSDHEWTKPGPCPVCGSEAVTQTHTAATLPGAANRSGSDDATAPAPRSPKRPVPAIPRYELGDELGAGGMGVVYRATHTALGREVAIKLIRSGELAQSHELIRFLAEAEVVAKLRHPNIVQVFDVGVAGGCPFYVMEFIPGRSLAGTLDAGPLSDRDAARLLSVIARAVDHAHQHGIVHRDLKPANILIAEDGTPKLVDFGVAKRMALGGELSETGKPIGTPQYMSPEQAAGKKEVGPATDVYALGVILYRMLTGRLPFEGDTLYDVLHQIMTADPVSPAWFRPGVPRDLEAICLKCLRKNPAERYRSAAELADDLDRYLNHQRISVGWTPPWRRAGKWVRRHPTVAASVGIALVGLGLLGAFAYRAYEDRAAQRKAHDDEMAAERRQRAMNDAITAAMGGDVPQAEAAMQVAQDNGATEGDVALLRGIVLFQQGKLRPAVDCLNRAIDLDPDSIAAQSLLAMCHVELFNWPRANRITREVQPREPITPHDYLFKGYLLALRGYPDEGLPLIEQAKQRKLLLAHACLARARAAAAFETDDRVGLEQAHKDLLTANAVLGDSPFLGLVNLEVQITTGFAYEAWGDPARAEQAWAAARRAAPTAGGMSRATNHRRLLADREGGPPATVAAARADWDAYRDRFNLPPTNYASCLYTVGKLDEGLALMREFGQPDDLNGERVRAYLLAEHPAHGKAAAMAVYDELERRFHDSPFALLSIQDIPLLLGEPPRVTANARRFLHDEPWKSLSWDANQTLTLRYLAGELAETEYREKTVSRRATRSMSNWWVGLRRLATGDRTGAEQAFRGVVESKAFVRYGFRWSKSFLFRMAADPTWPPWIKPAPQ